MTNFTFFKSLIAPEQFDTRFDIYFVTLRVAARVHSSHFVAFPTSLMDVSCTFLFYSIFNITELSEEIDRLIEMINGHSSSVSLGKADLFHNLFWLDPNEK